MSDEQPLLALLWPLARGRNAREAEAWGLRSVQSASSDWLTVDDDEAYVAHAAAAGAVSSGTARRT